MEDYLEELDQLTQTQLLLSNSSDNGNHEYDPNEHKTNFAQAALLLQNAGSVYSRKVEYLHELVYNALDHLTSASSSSSHNNHKRRQSSKRDQLEDLLEEHDPEVLFLLLDDVLEDHAPAPLLQPNVNNNKTNMHTIISEQEQQEHTNTARAALAALYNHNSGSSYSTNGNSSGGLQLLGGIVDGKSGVYRLLHEEEDKENKVEEMVDQEELYEDEEEGVGFVLADDNDDGCGSMMDASEEGNSMLHTSMTSGAAIEAGTLHAMDSSMNSNQPPQLVANNTNTRSTKSNPWQLLDPHTTNPTTQRPLKCGKCYHIPSKLLQQQQQSQQHAGKRKRSNSSPHHYNFNKAYTQDIMVTARYLHTPDTNTNTHTVTSFQTSLLPPQQQHQPLPMRGLCIGNEFAYVAKETRRRKARERRQQLRLQRANNSANIVEEDDVNVDVMDFNHNTAEGEEDWYGDEDGGDASVLESSSMLVSRSQQQQVEDEAMKFEQLCRQHLYKFAKSAQSYITSTTLTRRVDAWTEKLTPILEEEETREEFDIHEYGRRIVVDAKRQIQKKKVLPMNDCEDSRGNIVEFKEVTRGCSTFQVGRLFLASLMLANSGNVAIHDNVNDDKNELCNDFQSLRIELLDDDLKRPMANYIAPSQESQ